MKIHHLPMAGFSEKRMMIGNKPIILTLKFYSLNCVKLSSSQKSMVIVLTQIFLSKFQEDIWQLNTSVQEDRFSDMLVLLIFTLLLILTNLVGKL